MNNEDQQAIRHAVREGVCEALAGGVLAESSRIDLLETAWAIIANAGGGDWEKESKEWQDAAVKWRDTYFGSLSKVSKASSEQPNAHTPPSQPHGA
jgi:hypothetical protein